MGRHRHPDQDRIDGQLAEQRERRERALDLLIRCCNEIDVCNQRIDVLLVRRHELGIRPTHL